MGNGIEEKDCNCGPISPKKAERPISDEKTAEQILSQVKLICDSNTGVFFFRHNHKLYMRNVEL